MITAKENQKVAERLLYYAVGGDLSKLRISSKELKKELAGLLNVEQDEIDLPRYVKGAGYAR